MLYEQIQEIELVIRSQCFKTIKLRICTSMHINQEGKQIKTDEIFVEIEVYNNNSVENPENTQIKKF